MPMVSTRLREIVMARSGIGRLARWGTRWSLWPVHLVTSCCGVEFGHTFAPGYDAERFGALPLHTMRQSNLIVVEGTVTKKMARVLRRVYDQMPEPKFVIAMGACALEGGLFWNSYHVVKVDRVVPVDVYIVGCPPTPEAVIRGFIMLGEKIRGKRPSEIKPSVTDLSRVLVKPPAIEATAKTH